MADHPLYDSSVVKEILPHRSPFLFVDRVMKLEVGDAIIAEKDLSLDESFFSGHFPGRPIMPGVLVSEALAQTSGLLLGLTWKEEGKSLDQEKKNLFLTSLNIKFFTPAKPGETLCLKARLKKQYGRLYFFEVAAYVISSQTANGTLTLAEENG